IGKDLEVGRTAGDEHVLHDMGGLAGVGHLGGNEIIEAAGNLVGHRVQQLGATFGAHLAPLALARRAGCLDGSIHVTAAGFADRTDHAVIHRRGLVEAFAIGGGHILTVNEVFNLAHRNSRILLSLLNSWLDSRKADQYHLILYRAPIDTFKVSKMAPSPAAPA